MKNKKEKIIHLAIFSLGVYIGLTFIVDKPTKQLKAKRAVKKLITKITPANKKNEVTKQPKAKNLSKLKPSEGNLTTIVKKNWGNKQNELGRTTQQEALKEGPNSVSVFGNLVYVLDQVNSRIQVYDKENNLIRSYANKYLSTASELYVNNNEIMAISATQEPKLIIFSKNSSKVKVVDLPASEYARKSITAITNIEDNYFLNINDDYSQIITIDSEKNVAMKSNLIGKISRSAKFSIKAGFVNKNKGVIYIQAHDLENKLIFETNINLERFALHILLLDTDINDNIYVVVESAILDKDDNSLSEIRNNFITISNKGVILEDYKIKSATEYDIELYKYFSIDNNGALFQSIPKNDGFSIKEYR